MLEVMRTQVLVNVGGPRAILRAKTHEKIGREERAEEHHLRGEEEPDAELAIIKARVGPGGDCIRDVHELVTASAGIVVIA
jgi:hypothetical protein